MSAIADLLLESLAISNYSTIGEASSLKSESLGINVS